MKPFAFSSDMVNMTGSFYPTGYMVLMFENQDAAAAAADQLQKADVSPEDVSLLRPQDVQEHIVRTVGAADMPLPSAGTESDTVRMYADIAGKGGYGLMVKAPKSEDSAAVMDALKDSKVVYGQKYRMLVIEDLV